MKILALKSKFTSVFNILHTLMSPTVLTSLKNCSVQCVLNNKEFYRYDVYVHLPALKRKGIITSRDLVYLVSVFSPRCY